MTRSLGAGAPASIGPGLQADSIRTAPSLAYRQRGNLVRGTRPNALPLFWRVFGTNAAVLVLAFLRWPSRR